MEGAGGWPAPHDGRRLESVPAIQCRHRNYCQFPREQGHIGAETRKVIHPQKERAHSVQGAHSLRPEAMPYSDCRYRLHPSKDTGIHERFFLQSTGNAS